MYMAGRKYKINLIYYPRNNLRAVMRAESGAGIFLLADSCDSARLQQNKIKEMLENFENTNPNG